MKKLLTLAALALVVSLGAADQPVPQPKEKPKLTYCGSAKSDKFHRTKCEWVKKIKPANLVQFESRADAVQKGYRPCAVCKP